MIVLVAEPVVAFFVVTLIGIVFTIINIIVIEFVLRMGNPTDQDHPVREDAVRLMTEKVE